MGLVTLFVDHPALKWGKFSLLSISCIFYGGPQFHRLHRLGHVMDAQDVGPLCDPRQGGGDGTGDAALRVGFAGHRTDEALRDAPNNSAASKSR